MNLKEKVTSNSFLWGWYTQPHKEGVMHSGRFIMSWRKVKRYRADILFSVYIRERDNWTCQRCRRYFPRSGENGQLDNSHYWERGNWCTRFDPENCDSLCRTCHDFAGTTEGKEWYKEFKTKQLGQKRYTALEARHYATCPKDQIMAVILVKELIKELEKERGYTIKI